MILWFCDFMISCSVSPKCTVLSLIISRWIGIKIKELKYLTYVKTATEILCFIFSTRAYKLALQKILYFVVCISCQGIIVLELLLTVFSSEWIKGECSAISFLIGETFVCLWKWYLGYITVSAYGKLWVLL